MHNIGGWGKGEKEDKKRKSKRKGGSRWWLIKSIMERKSSTSKFSFAAVQQLQLQLLPGCTAKPPLVEITQLYFAYPKN